MSIDSGVLFSKSATDLAPESLVARLRGSGAAARPVVDPGLAWGLRDWLEDALCDPVASMASARHASGVALRVRKEDLNDVLACEELAVSRAAGREPTFELVRGVLVDGLFRQWVTVGTMGDPWQDSLDAVSVTGDAEVPRFLCELEERERARLAAEVREHAGRITRSWPVLRPGWLGRTQERIDVPVAGGLLVLRGVVDLALGAPSAGTASVCLVELKSGTRRLEHRSDLHYYALLETLRSGAPPFRVATYYSSTGELDVEDVREDVLVAALQRVVGGARRLCRIASGAPASRTPNPRCRMCPELPGCEPALRHPRVAFGATGGLDESSGAGHELAVLRRPR